MKVIRSINIEEKLWKKYQRYIFNELARGVRRGGSNYPTRAEMTLKGYRAIL